MRAQGDDGRLLAGGRHVAVLRAWVLETGPDGTRIDAMLQSPNRWLLTFVPTFDVVLALGKKALTWRGVDVSVGGDEITITGGERDV